MEKCTNSCHKGCSGFVEKGSLQITANSNMLSCKKHIPYNEKINITHLFEEEMSTEEKWKKFWMLQNMKWQSESQKLHVMVVEKALLRVAFLSAWNTIKRHLLLITLLCYYNVRKNTSLLCISCEMPHPLFFFFFLLRD